MSIVYQTAGLLLDAAYRQSVIAVIGCGGKSTFIESLARECAGKKTLITPTTKIWPIRKKDVILKTGLEECISHNAVKGIQCLGVLNETSGKLEALPPDLLESLIAQYDVVLLEADGSRGLPCKGWLPDEPVIPQYCTHTAGIVSLQALGKPASDDTVLRLPEFSALTGLQKGETITAQALARMVCGENGMFRNGIGRQSIFVNQLDPGADVSAAGEWLNAIRQVYPDRFACLAYGSALKNKWRAL